TADQDTPGPMAKSVTDAAIMLGALEGQKPDPNDRATEACPPPPRNDYTPFLKTSALKGARIGIPRAFFYNRIELVAGEPRGGMNPEQAAAMADAIEVLRKQGAVIVDPADIPSVVDKDPMNNFLLWSSCAGAGDSKGKDEACSSVLKYGMKR